MRSDKALVHQILAHADRYEWTLQGFGMLRLYLDRERVYRLHVWDDRYAVKNVSIVHDHPWHFDSQIIAGAVHQYRYVPGFEDDEAFSYQQIICGPGGCAKSEPKTIRLRRLGKEVYLEGEMYQQGATEIHSSHPERGTVTLVERRVAADGETARVFWPYGGKWVSAEPRPATAEEVRTITTFALGKWFQGGHELKPLFKGADVSKCLGCKVQLRSGQQYRLTAKSEWLDGEPPACTP